MVSTRRRPEAAGQESAADAAADKASSKQHSSAQRHQHQEHPAGSLSAPGAASAQQTLQQQQQRADAGSSGAAADTLDAFRTRPGLTAALHQLLPNLQDATVLLQPSATLSSAARAVAQALYDYSARSMLAGARPNDKAHIISSLQGVTAPNQVAPAAASKQLLIPQLCVDPAFDPEQIWMQLDLACSAALKRSRRLVASAASLTDASGTLIHPQHAATIDAIAAGQVTESDDEDMPVLSDSGQLETDEYEDDLDEDNDDMGSKPAKRHRSDKASGRTSKQADGRQPQDVPLRPTEDRFLRLDEMEAFLLDAEQQEERQRAAASKGRTADADEQEEGEEEDEDEGFDMDASDEDGDEEDEDGLGFGEDEDGLEDEDEEEAMLRRTLNRTVQQAKKRKAKGEGAMYSDFFGPAAPPVRGQHGKLQQLDEDVDDDAIGDEDDMLGMGRGLEGESDEEGGMGGDSEDWGRDMDMDGEGEEEEDVEGSDEEEEEENKAAGKAASKAGQDGQPLSTHQARLLRMQEQIRELEEAALGDKEWQFTGEVDASRRPLNSALAIDMDYDTTMRPPPEPTKEAMADIEAIITQRIKDHRFDDVLRVLPAAPPKKERRELELNDNKAAKGLGEEYEADYQKAAASQDEQQAGGQPQQEETQLHRDCKALFQALMSKLDALSHFHFAPKPVVEELAVRSDVAAVVMEEAAPVTASAADMRLPGEVFKPQGNGQPRAEAELTQEERKRRRAKRKRGAKAGKQQKEAEARARATAAGQALPLSDAAGGLPVAGRKSAAAMLAVKAAGGKKAAKKAAAVGGVVGTQHARTHYGKSSAVFAQIQQHAEMSKAQGGPGKKHQPAADKPALAAAALKL